MATTVLAGALRGIEAIPIQVEVDLLKRLPAVCVVGLPASAVKESAERIRSAIQSTDLEFPKKRVVINLAPADERKDGTLLDLPMALGILAAAEMVPIEAASQIVSAGELSLGGELRPIRGALSLALLARDLGLPLVLPEENAAEAALVDGVQVLGARTLGEVVDHLNGGPRLVHRGPALELPRAFDLDLCEVRGQVLARRALEIAAAGAHHLLLVGPPGCGKSMLARRLPTVLPPMERAEALETTQVHGAAGLSVRGRLMRTRPFRAPHHSVSPAGLVGNSNLRPGEVSLAHNGVLFLDEATEFQRSALELLREPLQDGVVRLTRAAGTIEYPAAITLVMATNPCPCGHRGSHNVCNCTDGEVNRYQRRLSGPILDRIDLCVTLQALSATELLTSPPGERSQQVRDRVVAARGRQRERGQDVPNGRLEPTALDQVLAATRDAIEALRTAADRDRLSGRATQRVLKVARTIADLRGADEVTLADISEAYQLRPPAGLL